MSVGEVEVAATFVEAVRRLSPSVPVLATSTTPAGMSLLSRRLGSVALCRPFPLDLPFSVRRFFDAARPALLVLIETELWPAVLSEAGRRRTPVLLVNGSLSERSARRYRAVPKLLRGSLDAPTLVSARSFEDAERFASIGVVRERIAIGGDMKLDRPVADEPAFAAAFRRLAGGRPVLVAGSIADGEVSLLLDVRRRILVMGPDVLLLLAPRRPASFEAIARTLAREGLTVARRSALDAAPERPDVFLLDSLGELAGAYRLGDLAVLGGTFESKGGHNVLEPLRAGLAVLHGPSVWNIRETLDAAAGAVFEVSGADAAARKAAALLGDEGARVSATKASGKVFDGSRGATVRAAGRAIALLEAARRP